MKRLKQIFNEIKDGQSHTQAELNQLLWQLICYSPKVPLRHHQQQLLDEAEKFTLKVKDEYFARRQLSFNGFKWGNGKHKILLTHGWGSKAADFTELITALKDIGDLQIIAFDAPGNGSSEGELSNLLLFVEAIKATILEYGNPDILIGHSLGAMANVIALKDTEVKPSLLISLTPLIRLKENFESSMTAAGVSSKAQRDFFESFESHFGTHASEYNLIDLYDFKGTHWLAYDENDLISPFIFMKEFLAANPAIESHNYEGVGHEKIIRSSEAIESIAAIVSGSLK